MSAVRSIALRHKKRNRDDPMKPSTARLLTAASVFVLVGIGLALNTGLGTPSSFGWNAIVLLCPLGAIEVFLAQKLMIPQVFLCLLLVVVLIVVFGRAFCGWLCPVPLLQRVIRGKKKAASEVSDLHECKNRSARDLPADRRRRTQGDEADESISPLAPVEPSVSKASACKNCPSGCSTKRMSLRHAIKNGPKDSRFAVLVAALASAALFGFPVFCIVCPVGLSFATFIALWRLVQFNEATLSLIVFPLILIVEIVVLKKWCHRFCPLGALISLVSKANKIFVPRVDTQKCLRTTTGAECHLCYQACPEAIDLHSVAPSAPMSECRKCKECAAVCPEQAIAFPVVVENN